MKNIIYWVVNYKNYDYKYAIKPIRIEDGENIVQFICKWAKLNEEFLESDIKWLISDLPNILDKVTETNKTDFIKIRVSKTEKLKFEENAQNENMDISKYIKAKCM